VAARNDASEDYDESAAIEELIKVMKLERLEKIEFVSRTEPR